MKLFPPLLIIISISLHADQIDSLQAQIDQLKEQVNTRQERASTFNPGITVFGNLFGCLGGADDEVEHDHGAEGHEGHHHGAACPNSLWLREVELDFRASVDPWADAVLILSLEQEQPGIFSAEVEEGYVTLRQLPVINAAPLGLKLKAGRFLTSFGRFNKIHLHDLPQPTLPFIMTAFFGDHGLARNGVSAQFLIPTPGDDNALTATIEVVGGGGIALSPIEDHTWPGFLGHLGWFFNLSDGHDLELGASAYVEPQNNKPVKPVQVYGGDFNYKWKPFDRGEWRSFLFGGEAFLANVPDQISGNLPFGFFAWSQYQFNQNAYLGLRYTYGQNLIDRTHYKHGVGMFFTYYTTEFLRFRFGYERLVDRVVASAGENQVMFELNFVFGSHPVEPYWVNR